MFRYQFFQDFKKFKLLKLHKNSISFEVFFSFWKTANETSLYFGCKIQIYAFKKTFCDKIAANFEIRKLGPKWHLDIYNLQIFIGKSLSNFLGLLMDPSKNQRQILKAHCM